MFVDFPLNSVSIEERRKGASFQPIANVSKILGLSFKPQGEVVGNFVEDVVCLSPSRCARVRLVTANHMTTEPFQNFQFDGVVGLGLATLAVDSHFSLFEQMARSDGSFIPQFGYYVSDRDDVASEICFGGHDSRHMRSSLQWAPVHDPFKGFWQVKVLRVTVNGEEQRVALLLGAWFTNADSSFLRW